MPQVLRRKTKDSNLGVQIFIWRASLIKSASWTHVRDRCQWSEEAKSPQVTSDNLCRPDRWESVNPTFIHAISAYTLESGADKAKLEEEC